MNKRILLVIIILVGIIGISVGYYISNPSFKQIVTEKISKNTVIPSPTPFPFEDMTIPYLRNRSYTSSLGSLDQVYERSTYTGYLTHYTSDGLKINGLLTKPLGESPTGGWPAIVFVHGYIPPTQYQTLERYDDYIDYLARNGFVVFKIDLRGHADSEGEASGAYNSSGYIVDTLNAYAALQSSGFVNPKKIGLWGHSMAGNVTMRSVAAHPDIPAVVIWAGAVYSYTDQQKYGIQDNSYRPPQQQNRQRARQQNLVKLYGRAGEGNPFWNLVAPTNYLNDLKGAIELNHAVDDDIVNIGYSRDLNALLDKTSIPHELHEYPSGGHNISGASFGQAMENTVGFFKKYLD